MKSLGERERKHRVSSVLADQLLPIEMAAQLCSDLDQARAGRNVVENASLVVVSRDTVEDTEAFGTHLEHCLLVGQPVVDGISFCFVFDDDTNGSSMTMTCVLQQLAKHNVFAEFVCDHV